MSHLTFFYRICCRRRIRIWWFYKKFCQNVTSKKKISYI